MPNKINKPCQKPGCHKLTTNARCDEHTREQKVARWKESDKHRESSYARGYNTRWRRARIGFLKDNPLCVICLDKDKTTESTVVDHKVPHKGNKELFWDATNWQSLCKPCHDYKTATEDTNFARHGRRS